MDFLTSTVDRLLCSLTEPARQGPHDPKSNARLREDDPFEVAAMNGQKSARSGRDGLSRTGLGVEQTHFTDHFPCGPDSEHLRLPVRARPFDPKPARHDHVQAIGDDPFKKQDLALR